MRRLRLRVRRGRLRKRVRGGGSGCWRGWRLQVIPWSPTFPETYILPTLVLVLIGIYIYFAASFYNSSDVQRLMIQLERRRQRPGSCTSMHPGWKHIHHTTPYTIYHFFRPNLTILEQNYPIEFLLLLALCKQLLGMLLLLFLDLNLLVSSLPYLPGKQGIRCKSYGCCKSDIWFGGCQVWSQLCTLYLRMQPQQC